MKNSIADLPATTPELRANLGRTNGGTSAPPPRTWAKYTGFWSPTWIDPDTGALVYLAACDLPACDL